MDSLYCVSSLSCSNALIFCFTAHSEIYTLSLHDALPILRLGKVTVADVLAAQPVTTNLLKFMRASIKMSRFVVTGCAAKTSARSEERFSRNAETDLVCRLLLEKKKNT